MTVWPISIHAPTRGATTLQLISLAAELFQSTLPRGERRKSCLVPPCCKNFNPRSHEGSDIPVTLIICWFIDFNPRSHEGSDTVMTWGDEPSYIFQSTLPRGERQMTSGKPGKRPGFQSTLPRGERQQFSPKSSLFSQQKLSKIFNLNNKLF